METSLVPTQEEVQAITVMAQKAHESKYFDKLGGQQGLFSIAMYAREMNLPIMACLFGGMKSVLGKIELAPQLMNGMIRKAGHRIDILESSDTKCTLKGTRKDTQETATVSFGLEDARRAGLIKSGGGWDKYPSDMCFARAMSRLARRLFPDVIGIAYVQGEIAEDKEPEKMVEAEMEVIPKASSETINPEQYELLISLIDDEEYAQRLIDFYSKKGKCTESLRDLHADSYEKLIETVRARNIQQAKAQEMVNQLNAKEELF